ncbi:MAG: SDR family oxidoreductase [Pseudomonadota bacterium]|jgi:NAD(P)-dependent dehydrogenase (short-subunit alcohol dehydrogenase family)
MAGVRSVLEASKTALVFGGSGGLGAGCVTALAREWPRVAFTYRSRRDRAHRLIETLPETCKGYALACNVADSASVASVVADVTENCGPIGAVIFAAGCDIDQPYISQISEDQWRDVFETETMGFTRILSAIIPLFRAQGGGSIVAVTSMANRRVIVGDTISAAPKAAIEALCRGIAKEEGRFGIRANSVAPGAMNAGLGEQYIAARMTPEFWEGFRKSIPLKRFGIAADIGEAAAFFCSERASYFTGQTLIADGGYSL